MKKSKLIIIGIMLLLGSAVKSQVAVSVNIGSPPSWGPEGSEGERYYYLPDVEAYYDVRSSMFIYSEGGVWVHRTYLPPQYRDYDLYRGHKVVMRGYRGDSPYNNFADYRSRYPRGHRYESQKNYGERPGRGNSREKIHSNAQPNRMENHGNVKNEGRGNVKGNPRGNEKNMKAEKGHAQQKGHDEGKGKK